jgi:hypothetical protein
VRPTERHPPRGSGLFDRDHGVDEDGRIESPVDAERGTQVKLRHYSQIDPGNVEDGVDVLNGFGRLDEQASRMSNPAPCCSLVSSSHQESGSRFITAS